MKKTIFTFLWMAGSFVVGLVIFSSLINSILWIPAHADVSQPDVQRKARDIGLAIWILLIGVPLLSMVLSICGVLPGTKHRKDLMQT
ncbi:MAG: hypothetical protein ABSH48_15490 [Verrucomicrobiota bacterium]|jgi:hypothetical protein